MYLNKEEGERRFLEAHRSWCGVLTEEAQARLARTLTEAERQAIRDLKSFLFLEMFERDLFATETREEAERWLVNLIKTSRERVAREKDLQGQTEAGH